MKEWGKCDIPEKNPPTNGIVRHNSHLQKSENTSTWRRNVVEVPAMWTNPLSDWLCEDMWESTLCLIGCCTLGKVPIGRYADWRYADWRTEFRHFSDLMSLRRKPLEAVHLDPCCRRLRLLARVASGGPQYTPLLGLPERQPLAHVLTASLTVIQPEDTEHFIQIADGAALGERLARSPPIKANLGIVPDDAVGRRVFLGISRFPRSFIPTPLHTNFKTALKTVLLTAGKISSLTLIANFVTCASITSEAPAMLVGRQPTLQPCKAGHKGHEAQENEYIMQVFFHATVRSGIDRGRHLDRHAVLALRRYSYNSCVFSTQGIF
ncbi:hypothetical protein PR048_025753 [Dryococelus australis]|uniref:Uncharacterized protein n=1 Tax=Dryococelus australis TaxID=614101 RepID=A0ABQ9GJB8_9NEOP|nr:hypothetical protein PR048_025753 [Dryococelus australis]